MRCWALWDSLWGGVGTERLAEPPWHMVGMGEVRRVESTHSVQLFDCLCPAHSGKR